MFDMFSRLISIISRVGWDGMGWDGGGGEREGGGGDGGVILSRFARKSSNIHFLSKTFSTVRL